MIDHKNFKLKNTFEKYQIHMMKNYVNLLNSKFHFCLNINNKEYNYFFFENSTNFKVLLLFNSSTIFNFLFFKMILFSSIA